MGKPRAFDRMPSDLAAEAAGARTLTDLARRLGVTRQTVYRWRKEGKLPPLRGQARERSGADVPVTPPVSGGEPGAFEAWAASRYHLSRVEHELVKLADAALVLAHDGGQPTAARLAAMREYRGLVTALNLPRLDADDEGDHHDGNTPATVHPFPRA